MKVKFNIKDKSAFSFLEERIIGYKSNNREDLRGMRENSPYYLMKDEMYFKIDCGIDVGESVKIELFDRANNSEKELVNHYTYTAEKYDDVALKMVLTEFKVETKQSDSKGL